MENQEMNVGQLAQLVMDMYYQQFANDTAFIQIEQVINLILIAYADIINTEYQVQKKINKIDTGFSFVELSDDWLKEEKLEVKTDKNGEHWIAPALRVFNFDYDKMGTGVQSIRPADCTCGELIRIADKDEWKYDLIPTTDKVFYLVKKTGIKLISDGKLPSYVWVEYFPAITPDDEDYIIPMTKQNELTKATLQLLFIAKQGTPIADKSNDQNPNIVPAGEVNPAIKK